jgi:hypothetical protein
MPHEKVCRGGSINALSEMCRKRYRLREPADFFAGDLVFRLAASVQPQREEKGYGYANIALTPI